MVGIMRAVEQFWYTDASSSYQPGTCCLGGVIAPSASCTGAGSSPRAAAKGACCMAALSVKHKAPWAVMEPGAYSQ